MEEERMIEKEKERKREESRDLEMEKVKEKMRLMEIEIEMVRETERVRISKQLKEDEVDKKRQEEEWCVVREEKIEDVIVDVVNQSTVAPIPILTLSPSVIETNATASLKQLSPMLTIQPVLSTYPPLATMEIEELLKDRKEQLLKDRKEHSPPSNSRLGPMTYDYSAHNSSTLSDSFKFRLQSVQSILKIKEGEYKEEYGEASFQSIT